MSYALRDHTADVAVEATGADLGATFAAVAEGMAAAMCDEVPDGGERFDISVRSESRESLLFDYLDELIYQRDVREVLPVDNEATVGSVAGGDGESVADSDGESVAGGDGESVADSDGGGEWYLHGSARGVPFDRVRARDLKAVTYSEMVVEATEDGWRAYVVFDV